MHKIYQMSCTFSRLQLQVSSSKSGSKAPTMSPSSHYSSSPSPSVLAGRNRALTADVARWIEERDSLMQTGLYSDTNVIVQQLDQKIKGAMLELKRYS